MLEVVSTYPAHYQESIPIDVALEITFNKEVKDEYLTSQYFRLFVLPDYTGMVNLDITKSGNKVTLAPTVNMPAFTTLEAFIAGDMDTSDATLQGIQSTDGEVMDRNYTFRFTTSDQQEVDVILDDAEGTGSSSSSSSSTGTTTQGDLYVTTTSPLNNAYSVECAGIDDGSGIIDVTFNTNIAQNSGEPTDKLEVRTTALDDLGAYVEYDAIHGEVNDFTLSYPSSKVMRITLDGPFRCNSDIDVDISQGLLTISGYPSVLNDAYSFTFRTVLSPMLTTARAVKAELSHSISNLSDKIIDEYIFDVSQTIIHKYFNSTVTDAIINNYWVRKLATCMTVEKLIGSVVGGHLGVVRERTLGDLRIVYDITALREISAALKDCLYDSEVNLLNEFFNRGPGNIGVKSYNTTKYPGRRRDVFDL